MLLLILYLIGITADSMTGALAAGRNKFDLFGVIIIAVLSAIGGGTVRDVVLGHYPVGWVKHPEYFLLCAGAAILTVFIAPLLVYIKRIFLILDAVGLIVFAIIGTQIAIDLGYGLVVSFLAAILTSISGGILRDMLTGRVPLVFQKELYGIIALFASLLYYFLIKYGEKYGISADFSLIITLILGFSVRLAAIFFNLSLPIFEYQEDNSKFPIVPLQRIWEKKKEKHLKKKQQRQEDIFKKQNHN